ncbi:hypothetical protein FKM82_017165 [Ascaphus truei]
MYIYWIELFWQHRDQLSLFSWLFTNEKLCACGRRSKGRRFTSLCQRHLLTICASGFRVPQNIKCTMSSPSKGQISVAFIVQISLLSSIAKCCPRWASSADRI